MLTSTTPSQDTSFKNVNVPVLISGAGPTGLFAAILLTKLNIPVRLIERHLEVSPLSKALVIHSRTMELFAQAGIVDRFLELGSHLSDFHVYFGPKLMSVIPALDTKESHYNYGLFLEQSRTTWGLTEELKELGVHIDRGWELMDTKVVEENNADGTTTSYVETKIRRALVGDNIRATESRILGSVEEDPEEANKRYEVEVVRSEYLIATDGGKSAVRHKLNIAFPGRTLDNNLIIFDGHVDSDVPFDAGITVINGTNNRSMVAFPLPNGEIRFLLDNGFLTPEEHAALKPEELTMDVFERLAGATVAPAKFKCLDQSWLTYYRVNERQAETFCYKQRVFLAGDASHVHSPAGGQGMNTGLQDSFNLTWKIALVLHGMAPKTLLDSYEAERKPVADGIIKLSAKLLDMGLAQDFVRRTFKRIAASIAPYILPYINTNNPINMLFIRYHDNAINQRSKSQAHVDEDYQVGQRARDGNLRVIRKQDMGLAAQEGETVRLHQLLVGPGIFHILVFTSDLLLPAPSKNERSTSPTIKGVETTDAGGLAKSIEEHLSAWRSKWSYKSRTQIVESTASTVPGPTTPEMSTMSSTLSNDTSCTSSSLGAIPHPIRADKAFMVHTIVTNCSLPSSSSSPKSNSESMLSTVASTDRLADNKAGEGKVYLDHQGCIHQKYGVVGKHGPGAIVVVRPDSYIGYRVLGAGPSAWDEVDRYLETILA
ncbi:hypothetical protein K457DRAFT_134709 [Linnemannia elongata AG-77]|uniref:Uncharacterized protein n=1 Tax=Linnemannia elongata AG-77 TaxID=1314771 RepID=A0A197K6G0_9FUNG|nr:hypothetical protein K457DRAFT_134709 [Linnemannia elongata AG-77]